MKPADLFTAIQPVVESFEALKIPYYIGGSIASSMYGIARATVDVDMVADIQPRHVPALVERLESTYYIDANLILDAIERRSTFNLIHLETMLKVDLFVLEHESYPRRAFQRRRKDTLAEDVSTEFYFASVEDVVLSKLAWYRMRGGGSELQWRDVLGILKVQKDLLDIEYLEHWASNLQLTDLLHRVFQEAGITSD